MLEVPIVVMVCGEGGSGGALGIAIGDRVLMQEFAIYSVIPPEGCAAILWRDAEPQGRGGRGAQDHRARPAGARGHRRDRARAGRRRAQRPRSRHRARRSGADARRSTSFGRCRSKSASIARYEKFRRMGQERQAFVDHRGRRRPQRRRRSLPRRMKSAPLAASAVRRRSGGGAGVGARAASRPSPGCCACAGFGDPDEAQPLPEPVARAAARSIQARRHGPRGRPPRAGARPQGAHRDPRRLRRRRDHVDRDSAPGPRAARWHGESTSFRNGSRTATACSPRQSTGCTPRVCQVIVSVDCGIRGADAARRARELGVDLDHHRPPRARHRAAGRAGGHQPEAARLHAIRTNTWLASASR